MKNNAVRLCIVLMFCSMTLTAIPGCSMMSGKSSKVMHKKKTAKKVVPRYGIVTDISGINGNETNITLNSLLKAQEKSGKITMSVLQSHNNKDYSMNLKDLSEMGSNVIFAVGPEFRKPVTEMAEKYKDKYFCLLDGIVNKPNVISVEFKENEGAFLAGVLSALVSQSKKVSFIGDVKNPSQERYEAGFTAGLITINPAIKVTTHYVGSVIDTKKAMDVSISDNKNGSDIIFTSCGKAGQGVLEAANQKSFWVINASKAQAKLSPKNILAYIDKKIAKVVKKISKAYESKKVKGIQVYNLGIKDKMIDLVDAQKNLPKDVGKSIKSYKKMISDEKIVVPYDIKTLQDFKKKLPEIKKLVEKEEKKSKVKSSSDE